MEGYETTQLMQRHRDLNVLSTDSYQKKYLGPVNSEASKNGTKTSEISSSLEVNKPGTIESSSSRSRLSTLESVELYTLKKLPLYMPFKSLCNLVHLHLHLYNFSRDGLFKVMSLKSSLPSLIDVTFMPTPEEQELYNFCAAHLTFRGTEQPRYSISTTKHGSLLPASSNTTNPGSLFPARSNIPRRLIRKDNMVEWMLLGTSLGLETLSAIFDQLSSPTKPHYALFGMLTAIVAVLVCISELVYNGRKERVVLRRSGMLGCIYYPTPRYALFGSLPEVFGLVAGSFQCSFSIVQYDYLRRHHENPIKLSAVPLIFLLCLIGKRLIGDLRRRRERLAHIA